MCVTMPVSFFSFFQVKIARKLTTAHQHRAKMMPPVSPSVAASLASVAQGTLARIAIKTSTNVQVPFRDVNTEEHVGTLTGHLNVNVPKNMPGQHANIFLYLVNLLCVRTGEPVNELETIPMCASAQKVCNY